MKIKKITALLMGGAMAASLFAGCGSLNTDAVLATMDGVEIPLGVANLAARLQQATYDDFYTMYFGEDVWSTDMYGLGYTMEDELKDSVISMIQVMYTMQAHAEEYGVALTDEEKAAITDAAERFITANSEETLEALGATQEIVEEYLTLATIEEYMYDAIIAEVDTEVSDEEANTSAYSYVVVSKTTYTDEEGNSASYTEDELTQLASDMEAFAEDAAENGLEAAAETAGYTVAEDTFTADDAYLDEEVLAALQELDEGAVSGLIELDSYYYVVRLDAVTDEEATEETRQSIIEERQSEYYSEVLTAWEEASGWELNEKVWAKVTFSYHFTTIEESTESVSDTETAEETEAVSQTEESTEEAVESTEQ